MNKIKKALATFGVAMALAVSGGGVAQVATADNNKAQAYNYTQGPQKWQNDRFLGSNGRWYCGVWAYVDYSFWEEISYPWPKDGWKRLYYAYC